MRLSIIALFQGFSDGSSEWGKFRATVLAHVPFVTHIFVIALASSAAHAHELALPVHAGAPILAADDEFAAQRSDAATTTWDWRLTGTILAPNLRMALFAQPGKTRAVQEGKVIDGWMVVSVRKDGVTLSAADHIRVIQLEGTSSDEADETARQQADEHANAAVAATARPDDPDDLELKGPMRDLVEATRRMTRREAQDSIEPSD
jgi:hypothetical protein